MSPTGPLKQPTAAVEPSAAPEASRSAAGKAEAERSNTSVSPPGAVRRDPSAVASAATAPAAKRLALPDAESPDEALLLKLVQQGQQMLIQGHVASARLLFRRAADSGSPDGALLLGDTFDAQRLSALGVRGIAGDVEQSIRWYEKADEMGSAEAKGRLLAISGR